MPGAKELAWADRSAEHWRSPTRSRRNVRLTTSSLRVPTTGGGPWRTRRAAWSAANVRETDAALDELEAALRPRAGVR